MLLDVCRPRSRGRAFELKSTSTSSVVTGRNGRLVMVSLLGCERVRGITQTFWMGDPVSEYGDVLIDADVDVSAGDARGPRFSARQNELRSPAVAARPVQFQRGTIDGRR